MTALEGASVAGGNVVLVLVAVASVLGAYLFLAALWYFAFRGSPSNVDAPPAPAETPSEATPAPRRAVRAAHDDEGHPAPTPARPGHGRPLRIERPIGSRFRRR